MEETKVAMMLEAETKDLVEIAEKLVKVVNYELNKGIEQVDTEEMKEAIDMIKDIYEAKAKLVKACYYKTIMEAMEKAEEEGGEDGEDGEMDDGRRGYRGQPRSRTSGRYMRRGDGRRNNGGRRGYEDAMMYNNMGYEEMEYMRDMDKGMNRMYYSGGGSSGGSGGQSGSSGGSGGMSGGGQGSSGSMGYSESGGGRSGNTSRSENARRGYEESKMMNDNSPEGKKKAMEHLDHYMKELSEDMTEMIGKMDNSEKTLLKTKLQGLVQKIQ